MPLVLQVLEATIGGTRRHLRELAPALQQAGWGVAVAVARRRDPDFERDLVLFRKCGIAVYEIDMVRRPAPCRDLLAWWRLRRLIVRLKPDLIHAHSTKAGLLARLAVATKGPPVIYTPHCFAFEMKAWAALRRLYRYVERRLIPRTAHLIAVSEAERRLALELGYCSDRVTTIVNGIPASESGAAGSTTPLAAAAASAPSYDVVFIGRFCHQKGIDLVLELFERLLTEEPTLRLAVMGGGSRAIARRLSRLPNVTLLPFAPHGVVLRLLATSRVVVLPSRWEGLPYLLLEALASGTAVVASAIGGVGEVARHEREALLVPPGNLAALTAATQRLLADEQLRVRLTAAARQRVTEFTLGEMVEQTAAVYGIVG